MGEGGTLPALRFADAARRLGAATRAAGLVVPAFRCPPRLAGAQRSLRRYPGGIVVSVVLRGRRFEAVVSDMVEGVLVANGLTGDAAVRLRTTLLEAARDPGAPLPGGPGPPRPDPAPRGVASPRARVVERQTRAA